MKKIKNSLRKLGLAGILAGASLFGSDNLSAQDFEKIPQRQAQVEVLPEIPFVHEADYKPVIHVMAYVDKNCNGRIDPYIDSNRNGIIDPEDRGDRFYNFDGEVYSKDQCLIITSKPIERKAGSLAGIKVLREEFYKQYITRPVPGEPGAVAGIMELRSKTRPILDFHTRLSCDNSEIFMGPIKLRPGNYRSYSYSDKACSINAIGFKVR